MTPYQAVFPPLGLLTLAALTPPDFHVTLCDENAGERVDYDTTPRSSASPATSFQKAARASPSPTQFRQRGKTVVIGGPMANLLPEECRPHCDVLFEGEAEYTWPRFLREYAGGTWADHYVGAREDPPARFAAAAPGPAPPAATPTASCNAPAAVRSPASSATSSSCTAARCASSRSSRCCRRSRPGRTGVTEVFFADDNFIGNRAYAKDLLRALAAVERRQAAGRCRFTRRPASTWSATRSCCGLLRDANFISVFIGIESPRKASLAETHKTQNEKLDLVEAVHKIQSYNLFILAGHDRGLRQRRRRAFSTSSTNSARRPRSRSS